MTVTSGTGKSDLHKQNVRVCFFSEQKCIQLNILLVFKFATKSIYRIFSNVRLMCTRPALFPYPPKKNRRERGKRHIRGEPVPIKEVFAAWCNFSSV
jgi:hypothetical protein